MRTPSLPPARQPLRSLRLLPALLTGLLLFAAPARAWQAGPEDGGQDAGGESLPDASVDEGGADRDEPGEDDTTGRVRTTCRTSLDCDRGFTCVQERCHYIGVRDAEGSGCFLGVQGAALVMAAAVLGGRRARGR